MVCGWATSAHTVDIGEEVVMKRVHKVERLIAKQEAWDKLPTTEKKGTKRPGSLKKP